MFRLIRLPFRLLKLAVIVVVMVVVWRMLPTWVGEHNVSAAVQHIKQGVELIWELTRKLN